MLKTIVALICSLVLLCTIGSVTPYLAPYKRDVHGHQVDHFEGKQCSHQFCINKDYKKLELPPPNNGSIVQVVITPHILEIFEVNKDQSG